MENGLQYADIVKLTDVELEFITGAKNLSKGTDMILKYGPRMVIVTRGKESCFFNNGEIFFEYPPFKVQLVDATGAGDAFVGAILFSINRRLEEDKTVFALDRAEIEEILRFATGCGALTVTRKGVIPALPTFEEAKEFLNKN